MPISSSRKFFNARHPSNGGRKSIALTLIFVIGLAGLLLIGIVILKQDITGLYKCKHTKPISISVAWDQSGGAGGLVADSDHKRHKVMAFVGIQTGFASAGRRKSLRKTWMPSDHQGLQRYESSILCFVILRGNVG